MEVEKFLRQKSLIWWHWVASVRNFNMLSNIYIVMFHLLTYYIVCIKYKRCKSAKLWNEAIAEVMNRQLWQVICCVFLGIFYSYLLLARRVSWVGESASRTHFHRKIRDGNRKMGLNSCKEVAKAFVKCFYQWEINTTFKCWSFLETTKLPNN